jgi:hypothetical protein
VVLVAHQDALLQLVAIVDGAFPFEYVGDGFDALVIVRLGNCSRRHRQNIHANFLRANCSGRRARTVNPCLPTYAGLMMPLHHALVPTSDLPRGRPLLPDVLSFRPLRCPQSRFPAAWYLVTQHASFFEGSPGTSSMISSDIVGGARPSSTIDLCRRFPAGRANIGHSRSFGMVGFFGSPTAQLQTQKCHIEDTTLSRNHLQPLFRRLAF